VLLKELFAENPQDLWRFAENPARKWEKVEEFKDLKLVPASDPNVPSQSHRIMQGAALATLAQNNPEQYNQLQVQMRLLANLGISDGQSLLNMNPQPQGPDPKMLEVMAKQQQANQQAQAQLQKTSLEHQGRMQEIAAENDNREADRQNRVQVAAIKAMSQSEQTRSQAATNTHAAGLDHAAQVHAATLDHAAQVHKTNTDFMAGLIPQPSSPDTEGSGGGGQ
jgi:hypothetical protein